MFSAVFPGTSFDNPTISHTVGQSIEFKSTKKELTAGGNVDLFIGWQVILGIVGMTSVFDLYLKSKADALTGNSNSSLGIFKKFDKLVKTELKQQPFFEELRRYHAIRDISLHNKGIVNQSFMNKTASKSVPGTAHIYYPTDLNQYHKVLEKAIDYIESKSRL